MEGIVYYNVGQKCLVRLAVSLSTLVKVYSGPITILADGTSYEQCSRIAKHFKVNVLNADFDTDQDKNWVLLNKCRLHEKSPYDKTIFIDSDTIILSGGFQDIFNGLDDVEFMVTQFANWLTTGSQYSMRIKKWKGLVPDSLIKDAFTEIHAVNTGFYAWRRGAEIFTKWYDTAKLNRQGFIPDEIACQLLLPQYNCRIISKDYNTSCKFDEITESTKVLHFHGKKHCRLDKKKYLYHSDLWYKAFDEVKNLDIVFENLPYDRMLTKNLGAVYGITD